MVGGRGGRAAPATSRSVSVAIWRTSIRRCSACAPCGLAGSSDAATIMTIQDLLIVPSCIFVGDVKSPRGLDSTREGGGDDATARRRYRGYLDGRIAASPGEETRCSPMFDK